MKKYVFIITLVLLFSLNTFSDSLYEELISTPDINYNHGEGEVSYIMVPIQYLNNYRIDGIDHQLDLKYAAADNILLEGRLFSFDAFDTDGMFYAGSIKYKFIEESKYSLALGAEYGRLKIDNSDSGVYDSNYTSLKLLTDYKYDDTLTFHNNILLGIPEDSDDERKELISGLSYDIDTDAKVRLAIEGYTDKHLSDLDFSLKVAYQNRFYDKYIFASTYNYDFAVDDYNFKNQIAYLYSNDLTFKVRYTTQSGSYGNDNIRLMVEKDIDENFSITGEYQRDFGENTVSSTKAGIVYRF